MQNTVTGEQIEALIDGAERISSSKVGAKTFVTHIVLENGFEMIESFSCVDPLNYDEEVGKSICLQRIKNKLRELESYKLQCDLYEIKNSGEAVNV